MKYTYFIPYKEEFGSIELAYIVLKTIIANHEVLCYIVSNRAKLYVSKFWKVLTKRLRIDYRASTAYYSQTDGIVEYLN
jgi:hypothetical protein